LSILIFSTPPEIPTGSGTISTQITKSSQWHLRQTGPCATACLQVLPTTESQHARCLLPFDDRTFVGDVRSSDNMKVCGWRPMMVARRTPGPAYANLQGEETAGGLVGPRVRRYGDFGAGGLSPRSVEQLFGE